MTSDVQHVVFELVDSSSFTRHPCHLCGGWTDKWVYKHATVTSGPFEGYRACENCLKKGDDIVASSLALLKEQEAFADMLRALLGSELQLPSYQAWRDANDAADAEYVKANYPDAA